MNDSINEKSNRVKIEPRLLKGFRDYAPSEQVARQNLFSKIQTAFELFGFLPLSTPVLEYKEILMGKYGEDEKLVYSFKDNGERDVAMRYDLTVPLARFIAQNQGRLTYPFKRYQIAPVWRADNPQKGRLREFYQCDVDSVGTTSNLADAEVIACLCKAIEAVGVVNYKVRLNDRRNFEIFGENASEIIRSVDKFDKIGSEAVVLELKQKNISDELIDIAKQVMDGSMALPYKQNLEELKQKIINLGVSESNITIDPSIARGLDYYTSTVFEIMLTDKLEYGSICSGGRYDSLVDQFSNTPVPAVGGSIGIDRLFDALTEMNLLPKTEIIKVMVMNMEESLQLKYLEIANSIRKAGINTELYPEAAKMEKQFKYAESKGIPYAIILGLDEDSRDVIKIKNLETREQQELSLVDAIKSLE